GRARRSSKDHRRRRTDSRERGGGDRPGGDERRGRVVGSRVVAGNQGSRTHSRLRGSGALSRSQGMTSTQPTDRFGAFGGRYVPETLIPALDQLEAEYAAAQQDESFRRELSTMLSTYVGRP